MNRYMTYLASTLLALTATPALAQSTGDRAETWDIGLQVINTSSENFSGESGSSLVVDSDTGWGFTAGYNFSNRLAVMFDMNWVRPDYEATRVLEGSLLPDIIRAELDIFTYQFKGVFNFLEGPFTPFVEAGIGWTRVDSNILDGPPTTGCWWDPWWGYICDTFYSTYADTRTSYMAGAGLRYDLSNGMSLKASYGILEVDTDNATEDVTLDTWRAEIIWRF